MKYLICIAIVLLMTLSHYDFTAQTQSKSTCSEGWYVTGYYIPREDELPSDTQEISVERVGNLSFSQEFLNETRTEGWGITRFGWAITRVAGIVLTPRTRRFRQSTQRGSDRDRSHTNPARRAGTDFYLAGSVVVENFSRD